MRHVLAEGRGQEARHSVLDSLPDWSNSACFALASAFVCQFIQVFLRQCMSVQYFLPNQYFLHIQFSARIMLQFMGDERHK